jgi:hypothetical protein
LDEAFNERLLNPDEWDCYMAGQKGISNILLNCGKEIKSLGKMSIDDYYDFAKEVDLGVSLMLAPHPSYPPLELSSFGAAVVTTAYETKTDLSMYNKNLVVAEPNVKGIKLGLSNALKIGYVERIKNAKATTLSASWNSALESVTNDLAKKLGQ